MDDPDVWPVLLDMSRDDCKRILRRLELEAYSNLVSVLRAQGTLTAHKRRLLQNVAQTLSISEERHKAECRRAVNSEKLATIAKHVGGANSGTEWAIEGRRLVPLLPRLVPQTAFTAIADKVANMAMTEGAQLPLPTPPVKRRITSPPIDEALLEPGVPEASKTPIISSASPLSLPSPSCDVSHRQQPEKSVSHVPVQFSPSLRPTSQGSPLPAMQHGHLLRPQPHHQPQSKLQTNIPSPTSHSDKIQEPIHGQMFQSSNISPVPSNHTQIPTLISQPINSPSQSQVVLMVKKDGKSNDECLVRKRPRSASLDVPSSVQDQESMMPPPKKEALSPLSPLGTPSCAISPQSHSLMVQQQTLQAAAAAAAAVTSTSAAPVAKSQTSAALSQQQSMSHPNSQPIPLSLQSVAQIPQQQQLNQQPVNQSAAPPTSSASANSRSITIPSQGTVKLSLSTPVPHSAAGVPSGTHKVIIVSSTTPSILQRSLSVPVVKSLSTSAPSQPCTSTLVLNPVQQAQQSTNNASNVNVGNADSTTNTSLQTDKQKTVTATAASKSQGKVSSQSHSKTRPRANSIVIPVTPNQANVLSSVAVTSMQLKSALQAGKQGVLKSGDSPGLKIMPIASMGPNSKLLPKPSGSGPIYVVSSTPTASSSVSRTVPSGARVMTFTSSLPKVAVSSSQGGTVLSMSSKPVQTLQLTQASGVGTSPGSTSISSTPGKPNVIVVQKGSASFGRGVTLTHASKDVVGKVLLGSKTLTSLNQSQIQSSTQIQVTHASTLPSSGNLQVPNSQISQNQASISATQSLSPLPVTTSTSARMLTVQKLPSAVVQGSGGSSNVIVLDLSQEQYNNSAVLNEILASSILQTSGALKLNHEIVNDSRAVSVAAAKGASSFKDHNEFDSGLLLQNDKSLLVEGFDQSTIGAAGNDVEPGKPESLIDDDSLIHGEPSSSSRNSTLAPRNCSDIFATALSNANLNLNDFLDDNSLDGIQTEAVEELKMELATDPENFPDSSSNLSDDKKMESWGSSGGSHTINDLEKEA